MEVFNSPDPVPSEDTVAALKGIPTKVDLKGILEQNVVVVDFTKTQWRQACNDLHTYVKI